jgi:hypothetical protein
MVNSTEYEALIRRAAEMQEEHLVGLLDEYGTGLVTMPLSPELWRQLAPVIVDILEDHTKGNRSFKAELLATILHNIDKMRALANERAIRQARGDTRDGQTIG